MIIQLPSGRYQARLKVGRAFAASRTFATHREAKAWIERERRALDGGVDPRAGRISVSRLIPDWLVERKVTVTAKTYKADHAILRLTPPALGALHIASVTDREVSRALVALTKAGLAESSVRRYRASLSSFFAWAVRERLIVRNPVTGTRVPRSKRPKRGIRPFTEVELEEVYDLASEMDQRLADIVLIAGWTGLRWSELRAMRVGDLILEPLPMLVVQRAEPEGVDTKGTKSGKSRRIPVPDRILPLIALMADGRRKDDRLFVTAAGHTLHLSSFKRSLDWPEVGSSRRIHDLRHTAACLWLARGVDPVTVQTWMGHASMTTTNIYLHHYGSTADHLALLRLNSR